MDRLTQVVDGFFSFDVLSTTAHVNFPPTPSFIHKLLISENDVIKPQLFCPSLVLLLTLIFCIPPYSHEIVCG